jgi:hypothetical protein
VGGLLLLGLARDDDGRRQGAPGHGVVLEAHALNRPGGHAREVVFHAGDDLFFGNSSHV